MKTYIDTDNSTQYKNGDKVDFVTLGYDSNNPPKVHTGTVVGKSAQMDSVNYWIIQADDGFANCEGYENYEFDTALIQSSFLRPLGSNKPFLCDAFNWKK